MLLLSYKFWKACLLIAPLMLGVSTAPSRVQAEDLQVAGDGVRVSCDAQANITLQNGAGQPLLQFGKYKLTWAPGETDGGTASYFTTPEGKRGIQVAYNVKDLPGVRIQGQFVPQHDRLLVHYDLCGPDDLSAKGAMWSLHSLMPEAQRSMIRVGRWQRDKEGGVPFEVPDADGVFFHWPHQTALVRLEGSNTVWLGAEAAHFPAKEVEKGHLVADGQVVVTDFAVRPPAATAKLAGRSLALDLWSDKPYNVWDDAKQPLVVHTESANVADKATPTTLSWWVRDFQGQVVAQGQQKREMAAKSNWDVDISVPAPKSDLLFLEVQAQSGTEIVFDRTNLAIIPSHRFSAPDDSLFGISAVFELPSRPQAFDLLQRVGGRWLRGSNNGGPLSEQESQQYNLRQNHAAGFEPTDSKYIDDPVNTRNWLKQEFQKAADEKAPYWEISNEWNLVGGIYQAKYARAYVDKVLTPANEVRHEMGSPVKIISQGMGGGDLNFIDALHEAGAWDKFDAFGLHPGRGNFMADYTSDDNSQFWTFLGAIRKVKAKLAQYGPKPLFLTEAYACTQENVTWHDTYRHAAENVLLSYALAKSEDVALMNWYQFNDSVWYNPGGVSDTDSEYHYGLLNFDLSPKPSLLAYRAAAIALDGARFVRWLNFAGTQNKGLLFETPQGPMAMLWNRADGYVLNTNHPQHDKRFEAPEAWVDDWPTKTKVTLPATANSVRELDCIGQERSLPVKGGQVELTLDGAPRIYYGLSSEIGK